MLHPSYPSFKIQTSIIIIVHLFTSIIAMVYLRRDTSCSSKACAKRSSSVYSQSLFSEKWIDDEQDEVSPCRGHCSPQNAHSTRNDRRRKVEDTNCFQEDKERNRDKRVPDQDPSATTFNFLWGLCSPFPYSPRWHEGQQHSVDSCASSRGISTRFSYFPFTIRLVNRTPSSRKGMPESIYIRETVMNDSR